MKANAIEYKHRTFKIDDPRLWIFDEQYDNNILIYRHKDDEYIRKYINKRTGNINYFDFKRVTLYDTRKHEFIDQLEHISVNPVKFVVSLLYTTFKVNVDDNDNVFYTRDTDYILGIDNFDYRCYKIKWVSVYHGDYCKIHKDRGIKCYVLKEDSITIDIFRSKKQLMEGRSTWRKTNIDGLTKVR